MNINFQIKVSIKIEKQLITMISAILTILKEL